MLDSSDLIRASGGHAVHSGTGNSRSGVQKCGSSRPPSLFLKEEAQPGCEEATGTPHSLFRTSWGKHNGQTSLVWLTVSGCPFAALSLEICYASSLTGLLFLWSYTSCTCFEKLPVTSFYYRNQCSEKLSGLHRVT